MTETSAPVLTSVLTCPACGAKSEQTMPTDACIHFHECVSCGTMLRPLPGHCCVFCSFGSVPCPPVQLSSPCCSRSS
ncbi:MAG TPA: GDCCVxC domain-containing (seleno)protein [Burkholderiaceae bacterium]|nr:GDCCVxC domain-containing (seleno)protein [Burkholderiaceae bacterium]